MGELSLIRQFRAHAPAHPWITVGPGQDCAVLSWGADRDIAFKIDQVVEDTHFKLTGPDAAEPSRVGWKAMAKACSDIAAAGFWPVAAAVAVNLRKGADERIAQEVYAGLTACCEHYKFGLAGGDIASSEHGLAVVVSLLGEGPRGGAWLRSGGRPGDLLFVTGTLGGSRARKHLHFLPRLDEARLIRQLIPGGVRACIDITDGLSRDLHHLCEESRCGARLEAEAIPVSEDTLQFAAGKDGRTPLEQALGDGEDFELLLAVDPSAAAQLETAWSHSTRLTRIGVLTEASAGCVLASRTGQARTLANVGYEH